MLRAASSHLDELRPATRHLLELAVVSRIPWDAHKLWRLSREFGWTDPQGRLLDYSALPAAHRELIEHGYFGGGAAFLRCAPEREDEVIRRLAADGQLAPLCRFLDQSVVAAGLHWDTVAPLQYCRLAFYSRQVDECLDRVARLGDIDQLQLLYPFDAEAFAELPRELRQVFYASLVAGLLNGRRSDGQHLAGMDRLLDGSRGLEEFFVGALVDTALARGDRPLLERLAAEFNSAREIAQACSTFLAGEYDEAERRFEPFAASGAGSPTTALAERLLMEHVPLALRVLLLARKQNGAARGQAIEVAEQAARHDRHVVACLPRLLAHFAALDGDEQRQRQFVDRVRQLHKAPLATLCGALGVSWQTQTLHLPEAFPQLSSVATWFQQVEFTWFAEAAERLVEMHTPSASLLAADVRSLVDCQPATPRWQRVLGSLLTLAAKHAPPSADSALTDAVEERIAWLLSNDSAGRLDLQPLVQRKQRRGWSPGRVIPLEQLRTSHLAGHDSRLTIADEALLHALYWGEDHPHMGAIRRVRADERIVVALLQHSGNYVMGRQRTAVQVVRGTPQLVVRCRDSWLEVVLSPAPPPRERFENTVATIVSDIPGVATLVEFGPALLDLHDRLVAGLRVPTDAAPQLLETLRELSHLAPCFAQFGVDAPIDPTETADPRPQLRLSPLGAGLNVELLVRPFGDRGPFFELGEGDPISVSIFAGQISAVVRDFREEARRAAQLVERCPGLDDAPVTRIVDTVDALETLLELQEAAREGQVVLHWPRGETFRLAGRASSREFRVSLRQQGNWFYTSGGLWVDAETQVEMRRLVELAQQNQTRYVPLDDGRLLLLTDELRRILDSLASAADRHESGWRIPATRAAALDDLGDTQLDADSSWHECVGHLQSTIPFRVDIPADLRAELRSYQREGFEWLARLANWNFGACLADDMGLGKTLQTIALLLHRASLGPALVVAPTSVVGNWLDEIQRFAPTLRPWLLRDALDRLSLPALGPRDVALASYGYVTRNIEAFSPIAWQSAALDEAQSIKNGDCERSRAMLRLQAGFRLILTGTPIENHLGELWNLFEFINPGLLGTRESFQTNFQRPIERLQCAATRERLRKLIQPFLLRRVKQQVLTELPPRTEIDLNVEMNEVEAAFYEILRQQALDSVLGDDHRELAPSERCARALVAITRLRRACCHPRLVLPDCGVSSAKLRRFEAVVDELRANGHRALVFSQFVDHLALISESLTRRHISYQYLDGSIPASERRRRIAAFQDGQGEFFLISLRAGGVGLNLTAADHVLHMDPWWNPAVEDQASDRAYRIGQSRPVTIYRFLTAGTIETQIAKLHKAKRELADSLLAGADLNGQLTLDELLNLIRGESVIDDDGNDATPGSARP